MTSLSYPQKANVTEIKQVYDDAVSSQSHKHLVEMHLHMNNYLFTIYNSVLNMNVSKTIQLLDPLPSLVVYSHLNLYKVYLIMPAWILEPLDL